MRCRLPAELRIGRRGSLRATVVSLSEGGLGVETERALEQGDPVEAVVHPQRGRHAVAVPAIVWNVQAMRARDGSQRRFLMSLLVSEPPPAYLALFAKLLGPVREPTRAPRSRSELLAAFDESLPRSKEPMAPPKPEPEETLPLFQVRVKQCGGPRSMTVPVNAQSQRAARETVLSELSGEWEVLEVMRA
ncbi:MAG: PilZ domain-containing protein [Myxococcota bacterium]|nr:PilZ domain-containing protein [Myxococcota bacterium]